MKRILVFLICISLVFGAAPYAFAEQDASILTGEELVNKGTAINAFWEIGEFDGEKGLLILSQLTDNSYNMKVTFRPEYDETSKDETSGNDSSQPSSPDNNSEPESEPEIEPGYSTEPEE